MRVSVASVATMIASPTPICLIAIMSPIAKPMKTAMTIAAAEVMIRPERCSPLATAWAFDSPASQYSLILASRNTS